MSLASVIAAEKHALVLVASIVLATVTYVLIVALLPPRSCHRTPEDAESEIRAIDSACWEYAVNNAGVFPTKLALHVACSAGRPWLRDPDVLIDPWGVPYGFEATAEPLPSSPRIWTLGRDGVPGGTGPDADVDNRRHDAEHAPAGAR